MVESGNFKFDPIIIGEFILLRKVAVDDAEYIYRLRSGKAGRYMQQPKDYSVETQRQWILSRSDNECNYVIHDYITSGKVGTVSIYDVSWDNLVCEVGRLLIEPKYIHAHTPYGIEALKLTYDYVFNKMGMRKMEGRMVGSNLSIWSLQEYLGMVEEGYLKRHVLLHGREEDMRLISIFKEDFPKYKENADLLLNKFRSNDSKR